MCVHAHDNDVPFEVLPASFLSFSGYSGHLSLDVPFKEALYKDAKKLLNEFENNFCQLTVVELIISIVGAHVQGNISPLLFHC